MMAFRNKRSRRGPRTPQACEQCRSRKTKCDGSSPCRHCRRSYHMSATRNYMLILDRPKDGMHLRSRKQWLFNATYERVSIGIVPPSTTLLHGFIWGIPGDNRARLPFFFLSFFYIYIHIIVSSQIMMDIL